MGRLSLLFFSILGTISAVSYADYGSSGCDGEFSNETWGQLATQEPRLQQELDNIAKASGQVGPRVKLTNCRVEWPVNEQKQPVSGYRTGVLHHIWYGTNEKGETLRAEGGIRLVWYTQYREVPVGGQIYKETVRTLKGFTICQSPVACSTLNVLGVQEAKPTPVTLNNPGGTSTK